MEGSRTAEVVRGVVFPLILVVVILALGIVTGNQAVFMAMLGAGPLLAAVFADVRLTAVVAIVTVLTALALAFVPGGVLLEDMGASLVGVVIFSVIAIVAAAIKRDRERETPVVTAARRKPGSFQLQTQADLDSMTGLLNRRGAIRALGPRNVGSERVIAFLDCDLFKSVNEEFGSDVGDEFLQAIAGRLRHRLPAHDTVARWDGDEFLLAISADEANSRPALERLVSGINGTNIRTTAGPVPATVSVGAALWRPGQELEDVIARAGRALYAAKHGGRGRIVVDAIDAAEPEKGTVPEVEEMGS